MNYIEKYLQLGTDIVILTMGGEGILASDGEQTFHLKPYSEKVVDVTGAGDSFWSGFLMGVLDQLTIKESIKLGNATAAFKVKEIGALSNIPTKRYLLSFINK